MQAVRVKLSLGCETGGLPFTLEAQTGPLMVHPLVRGRVRGLDSEPGLKVDCGGISYGVLLCCGGLVTAFAGPEQCPYQM